MKALVLLVFLATPALSHADVSKDAPAQATAQKLPRGFYENQLFSGSKDAPTTSKSASPFHRQSPKLK